MNLSQLPCWIAVFLISFIFIATMFPASAATYYVDATGGNDAYSGLSEQEAWATLGKVNSFAFNPGDSVLFKCRETWNGTLVPPDSGTGAASITFGAYGEGPLPVIGNKIGFPGGMQPQTWTEQSQDIWYAPLPKNPYRVWLDGTEYEYAEDAAAVNFSYRWYCDLEENRLYVYADRNPADYYSAIECLDNEFALNVAHRNNLEFQNLNFSFSRISVRIAGSQSILMHDCELGHGSLVGLYVSGDVATGKESVDNEFSNLSIDSGYRLPNTYYEHLTDGVHFDAGVYRNSIHDFTLVDWGHSALYLLCTTNAFPHGCSYNKVYNFEITAPSLTYGRGLNTDGVEGMTQHNEIFDGTVKDTWARNQFNGNNNIFRNIVIDTVRNSPRKAFGVGEGIMFECYSGCVSHDNIVEQCTIMNTDEAAICVSGDVVYNNIVRDNIMVDSGLDSWHSKNDIALYIRDWSTTGYNTFANNVFYQSNGKTNVIDFYGAILNTNTFNSYDNYKGRGDVIDNNQYYNPFTSLKPVVHMQAAPQTGDAPLEVQFTDASENNPTQWYWQFGDGTTATQQNPAHTYEEAGIYTVSLTATNQAGSSTETKADYITVYAQPKAPVAGFVTDVAAGDAPLTVQFTDTSENNPTQWYWQFGDGATSTAQNPAHTYENAGSYTAALTVTNADGTDTAAAVIKVTEPILPPVSEGISVLFADFDEGGEGVAYHDTTPTNEEFCDYRMTAVDVGMRAWTPYPLVTAIVDGEWLRYTMNIPQAGQYEADFYLYAPDPGRSITVLIDGVDAGTAEIPNGPDWQTRMEGVCTVTFDTAGEHQIILRFNGGDANADYFELVPKEGIPGDFNRNGVIDMDDVTQASYMANGLIEDDLSANFNNNGYIDDSDVAQLLYRYLEITNG